jgi:hypothetical protein
MSASEPSDARHEPVIEGRFLQLDFPIKESRESPLMIAQDGLSILSSPSFVAAPKIAIGQAIEEEEAAEEE